MTLYLRNFPIVDSRIGKLVRDEWSRPGLTSTRNQVRFYGAIVAFDALVHLIAYALALGGMCQ